MKVIFRQICIMRKILNKLPVTVLLLKILWQSLFFKCLTIFHWTLPKDNHGFELPIAKLRENTILNMPNTFLEAFLKFQTTWQWQLQYGKYYGNHCFSIVWQPSTEHCLKMFMNLDCPYQNWGKTLYWTCQTHFWKHF